LQIWFICFWWGNNWWLYC